MKRLLLTALLMLFPSYVMANACDTFTAATDCSTTNCAWSDPASWGACGGTFPGVGDTVNIRVTDTMILDQQITTGNSADIIIGGILRWDESTVKAADCVALNDPHTCCTGSGTGPDCRDTDGLLTLTANGGINMNAATARVILGPSDRIDFDSTAARRVFQVSTDDALLQARGAVHLTTVGSVSKTNPSTSPPCGETAGVYWTIIPTDGLDQALAKRRIVFQSGALRGWHFEIARVNAADFDICSNYDDASSTFQRLTPHIAFDAGRATNMPAAKHTTPAPGGNDTCAGNRDPWPCCSGSNAGNCIALEPSAGDEIAIIQDAFITSSTGTNGWKFLHNVRPTLPELSAVTFSDLSSEVGQPCMRLGADVVLDVESTPFSYLNFHDAACANAVGISFQGVRNVKIRWSAFHDTDGATTTGGQMLKIVTLSGQDVDGAEVTDSIFYRFWAGAVGIGTSDITSGAWGENANVKVQRNIAFGGCTNDNSSADCNAFEIYGVLNGDISDNMIWGVFDDDNDKGSAFQITSAAVSTATLPTDTIPIYRNWIVNVGGQCSYSTGAANIEGFGNTYVHNYCSTTGGDVGFSGGAMFSNFVKEINLALQVDGDGHCFQGLVRQAAGNFCMGNPTTRDTADCADGSNGGAACAGPPCGCTRFGFEIDGSQGAAYMRPLTVQDNVITDLSADHSGESFSIGACYFIENSGVSPIMDVTLLHNTCDNRGHDGFATGDSANHYGFWLTANEDAQEDCVLVDDPVDCCTGLDTGTCAFTHLIQDAAVTHTAGDAVINCSSLAAGFSFDIDGFYRNDGVQPTDIVGAVAGATCTGLGFTDVQVTSLDYVDRENYNYNFRPGAAALTGGLDPASSPLGARAFLFDFDLMKRIFPWVAFDAPLPTNISNVSNVDTDGDMVIDLHDNCDDTYNIGQSDTDEDGIGDACDPS